jgi:hypothetical protein
MGLDVSQLFGNAVDSAKAGMGDLLNQGGNAGLGYLEQQAIDVIKSDQTAHTEAYQASVASQLAQPSVPGSFSSYISGITQGPIVKQYGIYILAGVALVIGATMLVRR